MRDLTAIKLKQIGLRVTPQRQAILRLLKGNRTHPSAEDIYREVLKKYPQISFATVYNTLSRLAEAGEIQELDIDPNKKRFDPCLLHHLHFYCRVCRKVYDVEEELTLPKAIQRIAGHKIEAVQVNLKGVCDACAAKRQNR